MTLSQEPIPTPEADIRGAVNKERALWERVIFWEARRCGIVTTGFSAGQVLSNMADCIIVLERLNCEQGSD